MSDNDSDYHANAEIEALKRTLDCVRQITRDFENMAARRRMDNAELAVLSEELRQIGGNGALTVHPALAAAFQEIEQSMARRKALRKELCEATSAFAQELIKWANALKERLSRRNSPDQELAIAANVGATVEAPPAVSPPLEAAGTPTGPEQPVPEPEMPEVPNLGPPTLAAAGAAAAAAAAGAWALTFSEVMGKREENIIKYGNPYGPPSQYAHGSAYTEGSREDQSEVRKGWILYDGEYRGQDGNIYTRDGQIAVDANGNSRLSNEERLAIARSKGDGWTAPRGWRLPTNTGQWTGKPGDSLWKSNVPAVNLATANRPIPFVKGYIDLSSFALAQHDFKGLNGTPSDFTIADEWLAAENGFKNATAARAWRFENGLTWHHAENERTLQLVPRVLNEIPHQGGASTLRGQ